ncbi:MAG: ribonuclease H family protein [Wolbachia sp.]
MRLDLLSGPKEEAFLKIKEAICTAPQLAFLDSQWKICLQADASDLELGAIRFQETEDGGRSIVEYASRKLSPTEQRYCTVIKNQKF